MLEEAECCIENKRKKGRCDKRRFSDEQIRCLEVMFESETKLEPRKKVEVARELGLQPRQVAIWFQNKRARWKSKHIEKEYTQLLANYNALASQFESLKKEKNSLLLQLEKLRNEEIGRCGISDGESECVKANDFEVRNDLVSASDDDSNMNAELLQLHDQTELLKMVENTSDWGSLESDDIDIDIDIMNQPCSQSSGQWWDFWS